MGSDMSSIQLRHQLDKLVTSMCRAFNHSNRLKLLYALRDGPQTVGDLCQILGTTQSNTSQHLTVLRERGLLGTQRRGNIIIYSLRHPRVLDAIDILRDVMSEEVDRRQRFRSV